MIKGLVGTACRLRMTHSLQLLIIWPYVVEGVQGAMCKAGVLLACEHHADDPHASDTDVMCYNFGAQHHTILFRSQVVNPLYNHERQQKASIDEFQSTSKSVGCKLMKTQHDLILRVHPLACPG